MVCIIGDKYSPHVIKYCNYLDIIGTDFVLFPFYDDLKNPILVFLDIIYKFIHINLRRKYFNVIHIHYIGKYSFLGYILSLFGFKVMYSAWGSDVLLDQNYFKVLILKRCLKNCFAVLGDSERIKSRLLDISPSVNYIHYDFGVDLVFYNLQDKADVFNSKINLIKISTDHEVFVSVRRLEPIYNISLIIEAFIDLLKMKPNAKLIIMGNGSLFSNLEALIEDYRDNIYFFGEYNKFDLIAVLHLSPVIISASLSDAGLSTSIAECMTFGSICILSNNSDNHLWVPPIHKELLFELNKKDLYRSMIYALNLSKKDKDNIINSQKMNVKKLNNGLESTRNIVNVCYNG